jgi:hypothetical protein
MPMPVATTLASATLLAAERKDAIDPTVIWTVVGALAAVLAAVAAAVGLRWVRQQGRATDAQAKTAEHAYQASLPQVSAEAFIERPRRRVRIKLWNSGGSQIRVPHVGVVVRSEVASGSRRHEKVPTVRVEPPTDRWTGILQPHDEVHITLRRPDDSRFEEPERLAALVDIAGEAPRLLDLKPLENQRFYVPGVDDPKLG